MNEIVRGNRPNTLWIEYENVGDADLPAPLMALAAEEDHVLMRWDKTKPWQQGPLLFLAISPSGDAGILPPGGFNRIPVQYMGTGPVHSLNSFKLGEDLAGEGLLAEAESSDLLGPVNPVLGGDLLQLLDLLLQLLQRPLEWQPAAHAR